MTVTSSIYLEVNSVPLHTYGWRALDVVPLLADAVRGGDRLIPGTPGVLAFKRRRTVLEVDLPVHVIGLTDADGVPYANPHDGAITNLVYLKENLGIAESTGDGTVEAVLHLASGSTMTADVHVLGFQSVSWSRNSKGVLNTSLGLSFPTGGFGPITP